jgi:hypothetical protein
MTSRHLVDPELVAVLDIFPTLTLTPETLPLIRQGAALAEMREQRPGVSAGFFRDSGERALCSWSRRGA